MLDEQDKKEIQGIIASHASARSLSSGQKWDVAVLLASFLGGAIAVLGVAGYFVVENAAKIRAGSVAASEVASSLLAGDELLDRLSAGTGSVPAGAVAAFDLPDGCPFGWSDYASARGRAIIGATPQDGEPAGLTRRVYQQQGGAEKVEPSLRHMLRHSHSLKQFSINATGSPDGTGTNNGVSIGSSFGEIVQNGTGSAGMSQPVLTMPPYVALFYCRKD